MTEAERPIRREKRVLEYSVEIGNTRKACRYFGIPRSAFYRWKERYETEGDVGLVAKGTSWPGLRMCWPRKRKPIPRPDFFDENGTMPAHATLELVRPPGFEGMDDQALHELLDQAILRREAHHLDKLRKAGRKPLGRRNIRKQSPNARPASAAPRRKMSPRVAAKDKWRRVEALQRLQTFIDDYRAALTMLRAGFRDVVFPRGTYSLRLAAGVSVAPG